MRSLLIGVLLACFAQTSFAADSLDRNIEKGLKQCQGGAYYLALEELNAAYDKAQPGMQRARAAAALGLTYAQMRATGKAEPLLREAYDTAKEPKERGQFAIDLANLLASRGKAEEARVIYQEALKLMPNDPAFAMSVELNLTRLNGGKNQLAQLSRLAAQLPGIPAAKDRARFAINLALLAKAAGPQGLELTYQSLEVAREQALRSEDSRLMAEAFDELAQLYEEQKRGDDALRLTEQGILVAQTTEARDLMLKLEWRRGRLLRQAGKLEPAIVAYQRAVDHIEAIRQDIPVEYQDGRSSFRETLEPVYLGLADLLLQHSGNLSGKAQSDQLRRARNTLELIKQTELEDYLGDRCSVGSIRNELSERTLPANTAVLYPIILPERLELLLETGSGLQRATVPVAANALRNDVAGFASALRAMQPFQPLARRLYDRLLRPLDPIFEKETIDTIVVVPDGVLRLIPFSALHDGQRFAVQKYAIAVAPGLSMTNTQGGGKTARKFNTLLAGMSEPGAVVEKLPESMVKQLLAQPGQASAPGSARGLRIRGGVAVEKSGQGTQNSTEKKTVSPSPVLDREARNEKLKQALALEGVKEEIETLGKIAPAQTLLDQQFSVDAFRKQINRGNFNVVHIASHGVFGGSADSTFIMAHDDLITMDKLQGFLRSASQRESIELLTLSACETAEGDDRAPLGLTGAALKARAKTALGSLWPVADEAAMRLMSEFYKGMLTPDTTKAKALQAAQLKLIANKSMSHPFFWAPFIVVGSWL